MASSTANSSSLPTTGSSYCEYRLTWIAIRALRNASALEPGCVYIATDINWITAHPGSFRVQALDVDKLSAAGGFSAPTLNGREYWPAQIEWSNGRIVTLTDPSRDNRVVGEAEVQRFPWGVGNVNRVTIENGQFVYSGGVVQDLVVETDARLTQSGGTVDGVRVSTGARVTIAGGRLARCRFTSGAILAQLSGNGRIEDCQFSEDAYVIATDWAGRANFVTATSGARLYLNGSNGRAEHLKLDAQSTLYARAANALRLYRIGLSGQSQLLADGMSAGQIQRVDLSSGSYLDCRDLTGSLFDVAGSARGYFRFRGFAGRCQRLFGNSGAFVNASNSNASITGITVTASGYVDIQQAPVGCQLSETSVCNRSYVFMRRCAARVEQVSLSAGGRLYANASGGGRVRAVRCDSANVYVNNAAFTGLVDRISLNSGATLLSQQLKGNITATNLQSGARLTVNKPAGSTMSRCAYAKLNLNRSVGTTTNESLGWI